MAALSWLSETSSLFQQTRPLSDKKRREWFVPTVERFLEGYPPRWRNRGVIRC